MKKSIRLFITLLIGTATLMSCSSNDYKVTLNDNVLYDPHPTAGSVLLSDANLQGCLNQAFIASENNDPKQIKTLVCYGADVRSLIGINALPNLEQLELSGNRINDLVPLESLNKLRVLSIRDNQLRDIGVLINMKGLRFISLQGNNDIFCRQLEELKSRIGDSLNSPLNCR